MVVSIPPPPAGRGAPVFRSRNAPVPYVFLLVPAAQHPCPNSAACWSPATPRIGISWPRCSAAAMPNAAARRADLREHRLGHREQRAERRAPPVRVDVVEHRSRRVGRIGRVHGAVREFPDEPAVDRARGELVVRVAVPRAEAVLEHPLELRRGEVRVGHEPRGRVDRLALRREREAARGRAPVLPHDRAPDGRARRAIPEHHGLALVRDADRVRHEPALRDRLARRLERAGEDLVRVVLDLPGFGEMLRDLAIAAPGDAAVGRDDEAGRAGGALVDRENAFHSREGIWRAVDALVGDHGGDQRRRRDVERGVAHRRIRRAPRAAPPANRTSSASRCSIGIASPPAWRDRSSTTARTRRTGCRDGSPRPRRRTCRSCWRCRRWRRCGRRRRARRRCRPPASGSRPCRR